MKFIFLWFLPNLCFSFQLFKHEPNAGNPTIDPSYKSLTYYVSDTYRDFYTAEQKPITPIHLDGVQYGVDLLLSQGGIEGLSIKFGGLFRYDEIAPYITSQTSDIFHQKIYFDFTAIGLPLSVNSPAGRAYIKQSPRSGGYASGGLVRMHSGFINYLHPSVNIWDTALHEIMHVIGSGHSTVSSSAMAYTEYWAPFLASDDILGLANIYKPTDEIVTVTATLSGAAAAGIEIVYIDSTSGKSYIVLTNSSGIAEVSHLPDGDYYLAARELTPTGPCFANNAQGFLTSFYVNDTSSTNNPSSATIVSISSTHNYTLTLIPGTKNFDCHYAIAAYPDCQPYPGNAGWNCFLQQVQKNTTASVSVVSDLSTTHHQTDTDLDSGYHSSVEFSTIGTSSPFSVISTELNPDTSAYNVSFTVGEAENGGYAMLCSSGGEYALISSIMEVVPLPQSLTNIRLFPQHAALMPSSDSPRNFLQLQGNEPATESSPTKIGGMACGVTGTTNSFSFLILIAPLLLLFTRKKDD